MPHGQDVEAGSDRPSVYECLKCGKIVRGETHPGNCECGGDFQDRAKSLE